VADPAMVHQTLRYVDRSAPLLNRDNYRFFFPLLLLARLFAPVTG